MLSRARHLSYFTRGLRSQARYDYSPRNDPGEPNSGYPRPAPLATPRQLVSYLDEFVIGQEQAKKVLSVAVYNHYNRVRANLNSLDDIRAHDYSEINLDEAGTAVAPVELHPHPRRVQFPSIPLQPQRDLPMFEKSNVLVIGPTGSGKTLLAKTLARILDVPFSVSDATSFTQAGYVGEDVDACIQRLLQAANWDPYRASTGIVYIDEVDKIARKGSGSGPDGTRDVGGEGVQQSLLRIMEGSVVGIQAKGSPPEGPGARSGGRGPTTMVNPKPDTYYVDTSNVLFILSGAFVGLDTIVKRRVAKGSIGFGADLAPPPDKKPGTQSFMPFFTPNKGGKQDPLELVEPADIVQFGFIPEFISRLPSITTLTPLSVVDLRKILTEVRGSLVSQYAALFGHSSVEIRFTGPALDAICAKAAERGGGARGLRGIMESLLLEPMYEVPGSNIRHVLITAATVRGEQPALYWTRGQRAAFWEAWAAEEGLQGRAERMTGGEQ